MSAPAIAEQLGISRPTVTKWRDRFGASRLEGLLDEPRPGRPRTVSDDQVEQIVITTLESKPKDATHRTTRSLAAHLGVTQNAVWRTWQAIDSRISAAIRAIARVDGRAKIPGGGREIEADRC
jgi:transposase